MRKVRITVSVKNIENHPSKVKKKPSIASTLTVASGLTRTLKGSPFGEPSRLLTQPISVTFFCESMWGALGSVGLDSFFHSHNFHT